MEQNSPSTDRGESSAISATRHNILNEIMDRYLDDQATLVLEHNSVDPSSVGHNILDDLLDNYWENQATLLLEYNGVKWWKYYCDWEPNTFRIVSERPRTPQPEGTSFHVHVFKSLDTAMEPAIFNDLAPPEHEVLSEDYGHSQSKWNGSPVHFSQHNTFDAPRTPHIDADTMHTLPLIADALEEFEHDRIDHEVSAATISSGGGVYPLQVDVGYDSQRLVASWTFEFRNADGYAESYPAGECPVSYVDKQEWPDNGESGAYDG